MSPPLPDRIGPRQAAANATKLATFVRTIRCKERSERHYLAGRLNARGDAVLPNLDTCSRCLVPWMQFGALEDVVGDQQAVMSALVKRSESCG